MLFRSIAGTQKSRAYTDKNGEQKQWTETTANSFGVVPIQQAQTQPRPSPQGEQWGAQNTASPVNNGQAWPQQSFDGNPPF